jgi:hypothetical protein
MTGIRGAPSVAVVGGDAARWIVKVAGEVVATCGSASLARRTAEEIRRTLEREARIAAIRALADYLEWHPEALCDRVSASRWARSADALAESAARMPESVLDNTCDVFVRVVVDFGSGVQLEALLSRDQLVEPPAVRELPPQLAALPTDGRAA